MMTDRANPAETLNDDRNFPKQATADEAFEPSKFHDVKTGLINVASLIQVNGDLAMTFDPRDGRNLDQSWFGHVVPLIKLDLGPFEPAKATIEELDQSFIDDVSGRCASRDIVVNLHDL